MSDIKAMMKAAQDKEDEVLAKFNEFDLDGDRGIDEVRTRTPSHRREAAPVGRQMRIRCYRRAHAAVHAAARVIATESRALNFPPDDLILSSAESSIRSQPPPQTQMELGMLLMDLGMLTGVNQEADDRFVRSTFRKMDVDKSGYIDFEEFKVIYNKAIDRKKGADEIADLPPLRGRDVKALSPEVESQRRRIAERKAQEKLEREAQLADENRRKSQRIAEARAKGRDAKSLDAQTEALRQRVAEESRAKKAARERQIAEENAVLARRRAEVASHGRDAKALDEKTLADRRAVAERRAMEKAERERTIAEENAVLARRRSSLHGRDAKALDDNTEAMRREVEARRLAEKEAREAKISEENAVMRQRIAASKQAGRDSKGLSQETLAARERVAAERAQKKAEQEMMLKMENLEFNNRLTSQKGRDAKGLSPETLAARKGVAERSAQRKREESKLLARENAERKKALRGTGTYAGL